MRKIYISGQISGRPRKEVEEEFASAVKEAKKMEFFMSCSWGMSKVYEVDYETVNPLENGVPVDDPWEEHMAVDIIALMECHSVFMLPNWRKSRGARLEHAIAKRMGKMIYYKKKENHEKNH